jgi:LysR family transcriptional regulator, hydrogen peroxide-inducible genes activator
MVAAGVGVTLLPALAVRPPVPPSPDIHLLEFEDNPPSRRIAMVWRRSSAMAGFLEQLAGILRQLPRDLLDASAAGAVPPATTRATPGHA